MDTGLPTDKRVRAQVSNLSRRETVMANLKGWRQ
jgi:hypothetical protein